MVEGGAWEMVFCEILLASNDFGIILLPVLCFIVWHEFSIWGLFSLFGMYIEVIFAVLVF
jgi:hypothetical protein